MTDTTRIVNVPDLTAEQWDATSELLQDGEWMTGDYATLRLLGPRPTPPAPEAWSCDRMDACVEVAPDEGRVWVAVTRVRHTEIDLSHGEAREMAAALIAAADYVEPRP